MSKEILMRKPVLRPSIVAIVAVVLVFAVGLFLGLLPAGTLTKVNQENVDKIRVGMTLPEVEGILGPGKETVSSEISSISTNAYQWGTIYPTVTVVIQNGRVAIITRSGF